MAVAVYLLGFSYTAIVKCHCSKGSATSSESRNKKLTIVIVGYFLNPLLIVGCVVFTTCTVIYYLCRPCKRNGQSHSTPWVVNSTSRKPLPSAG